MTVYTHRYWMDHPDAPFAELLSIIEAYCHPEAADESFEDLLAMVTEANPREDMDTFKSQLREALEHPDRLPPGEHLDYAAEYSDGTDQRFLRRLWRDLYPGEPVPGGDEELRDDLRRTMTGQLGQLTSTTRYYIDLRRTDLSTAAREVWERFFPGERPPAQPD